MERIKLAISKARETASQQRQHPPLAAVAGAAQLSAAALAASTGRGAVETGGPAKSGSRSWWWAGVLLVVVAAVMGFRVVKTDTRTMSMSAAISAEAAPVPQRAVATPVRPAGPAETPSVIPATAGAPAVAAGTPETTMAPVPPLKDQVVAAVETWRQAWSKRDMTTYLDAYSDAFTPSDGVSREDWIASRYRNVGGRKSIDVQIQRLLVLTPAEGRARVSFMQDYTSGSVRELKRPKTLDLVKGADNRWRIVGEWQGDPPPFAVAGKS
jgi:hypothetical protein